MRRHSLSLLDPRLCRQACRDAILKLDPRCQWRNPVMFVVWLGSVITTLVGLSQWLTPAPQPSEPLWFVVSLSLWLWFTLLFANFAEALAEGRSKAQAASLRGLQQTVWANKLSQPQYGASTQRVNADQLHKGDLVQVAAGEIIPCDGDVVVGVASVDESAITGESAPVIREAGGDFSSVTGGTRVLRLPESQRRGILQTLKLAGELGAETATLAAQDEAQALLDYAREHNLGKIVIGRRQREFSWYPGRRFIDRLGKLGPDLDLIVVAVDAQEPIRARVELPPDLRPFTERWRVQIMGSLATLLLGGVLALFARLLMPYVDAANLVMLFLLGVVLIALRYGRGPASLAAIVYVGLFDFFFVDPHFSFAVSDVQYLLTFAVMLAVGLLIGQLTAGVRYQARIAHYREQRSRQLFELSKALSGAVSSEEIARLSCDFVARSFHCHTQLLLPDEEQHLQVAAPRDEACDVDLAVAQWCLDHSCAAGLGTDTLPAQPQRLVPLVTGQQVLGVLAIEPQHQRLLMIPEQLRLLKLYAVLIAIALERIKLAREAEQAQLQMESERLRNSLLSALSHDLRTPLTVLFGQAEILTLELGLAQSPQAELASSMRQQVLNTTRLVNNLLDMARLQSGGLSLRREWQSLPELIGSALHELAVPLQGHEVVHEIPADFPLLYADGAMLERVLVNVLENGCKYAGAKATFGIGARLHCEELEIQIWDDGPGLPPGKEQMIFEKFARGDSESAIPGVGLGLAICRAIIEAHGGRIRAENRPQGGARFSFTLPYKVPPQVWENIMEEA